MENVVQVLKGFWGLRRFWLVPVLLVAALVLFLVYGTESGANSPFVYQVF